MYYMKVRLHVTFLALTLTLTLDLLLNEPVFHEVRFITVRCTLASLESCSHLRFFFCDCKKNPHLLRFLYMYSDIHTFITTVKQPVEDHGNGVRERPDALSPSVTNTTDTQC